MTTCGSRLAQGSEMPDTVRLTHCFLLVLPCWLAISLPAHAWQADRPEEAGEVERAETAAERGEAERDEADGVLRAPGAMPERCAAAASDIFDQDPDDILVGDVVEDPGHWLVIGQFPAQGPSAQAFICTFGPEGRFERIDAV